MKYRKFIPASAFVIILIFIALAYLYGNGKIHFNYPGSEKYPVVGIDVSNYQGEIDWEKIAGQNIDFAFIKCTEGSGFKDPFFDRNWELAGETGMRIGAYHFFSFDSSGKTQGELFCETVQAVDNMLPPVIDVETYGEYNRGKTIDVPNVKKELRVLVDMLEENYGMKPIIYCGPLYDSIIKGDFDDCELWYRSVYKPLPEIYNVAFWQYSDNHILSGYSGEERFIDMNVFVGTEEEFKKYPEK
ncbi:MAG: glycoside hydrolase family 25 [Clostridia bacterium]|nr:glycoside hydrolase family 25 [Clostridia bacterium]